MNPKRMKGSTFHPLWRPRLLGLAVLATLPVAAHAQKVEAPAAAQSEPAAARVLNTQTKLSPKDPAEGRQTVIEAGRIDGRDQVEMTATDNVRLQREDMVLKSDRLFYDQVANEVRAQGNVRLEHRSDSITGPSAHVNLDTWYGEFDTPSYLLQRSRRVKSDAWPASGMPQRPLTELVTGSGQADLLKLEGENHYRLTNSTYTTCPAPSPSWYLKIRDLALDFDRDQGEATHSTLVFKDVPIAYFPWANFPLSGGRQSGFLPPTLGGTSATGFDLTVPYYFNIAPNYDATFAPRWMSQRGMQLGGEARYQTEASNGVFRGEYLDNDKLKEESRYLYAWRHAQNFGSGLTGNVDVEQVSDKTYFADMSTKIGTTSQSTLKQEGRLDYNNGTWLSSSMLVQRYQVLSGDAPYSRKPQLRAVASQADFHGLSLTMPVEYTEFSHPTRDEGQRSIAYPQISLPLASASAFVTPKIGMHLTHYDLTRRETVGPATVDRTVPVLSLDSGMIFERETTMSGREQIQTLEPRLYYARSTYRDQSKIPVFDSGLADFNFAQIFSENRYSGQDRIADSNQLTAGVQSRMIDASSGEEWLRTALAQRYYFADQQVTLPGETQRTGKVANVLGAVSGRVHRDFWVDNTAEYDQRVGYIQKGSTGLRYQPDFSKVASISYRYQRDQIRDLDISAQWPLAYGWYGVGRYNRNLKDHRLTEAIAGLEYKGDCWVLRGVWQTLVTTTQARNNSFFIQLELNGLASIGSNPVSLLKRSVSGYGKINEPGVGDPAFGD